MPDILIRDVEPEIADGLKEIAKRHHRSVQAELLDVLGDLVRRDRGRDEAIEFLASMREQFRAQQVTDSTDLVREDRDR